MKAIFYLAILTVMQVQLVFGQGTTLYLKEKDRNIDIKVLIQRIKPYKIDQGQIFFKYELNSLTYAQGALIIIDDLKLGTDISNLGAVMPSEIESITVLTNPEDYAMYTSLNVNGVIVIKTRR